MGPVQCFVMLLMLRVKLVLTLPLNDETIYFNAGDRQCKLCPPGMYQKSCLECESCPAGSYTTQLNREEKCHFCSGDCRPEFNLKVIQECTNTSNVKCVCEDGYECNHEVPYSTDCRFCVKIKTRTTTATPARDKHTPSTTSSGHSSSSAKPCQFPKCGTQTVLRPGNGTHLKGHEHERNKMSSQLAAILCPVVAVGCLALVILLFVRRPGDETCFKQAISKLRNEGGRNVSQKESSHQFPRDSFSAKQQPSCLTAANLGPVHVNNPGTVVFSLLSQFTGQVGPTIECGKTAKRVLSEEEDERDCPVFHPTSSPSIHLSEEERSGEIDNIFFPSQEQGKDCHVSKEEAL
ncbi:uncharacterized protein si:dkey-260g12.1 isoform X2 [Epinephelus fuscoguttatus]|uniref:uncharacterized protein si:dkey-260g12.1 isoform X2 n=1 Tax=Epinephelus fuscoguttatus TaxID=293821 RepID=UPI0020D0C919|nr:uncharacterized protein si:dkey-260g12.1 isoform X2 [Epinephelus fuscoguttatus]